MVSTRRGKVSSMKEEDILNFLPFLAFFKPVRLLCVWRVITLQINSMALIIPPLSFSATTPLNVRSGLLDYLLNVPCQLCAFVYKKSFPINLL